MGHCEIAPEIAIKNVTKEIYSFLQKNNKGPKNKVNFKAKSLDNL